jgi:hypothetical protein
MKTLKMGATIALAVALSGAGTVAAFASTPPATPSSTATVTSKAPTPGTGQIVEATTPEKSGTESGTVSDGPGGHQDPDGVNVNHQAGSGEQ